MASYTYVNIPLPEAQTLIDFRGIKNDLEFCKQAIGVLLNTYLSNREISESLSCTIIVKYARCFNNGRRFGGKELLAVLGGEEMKVHDNVLWLRNKHVGHKVSDLETGKPRINLNPEERGRAVNSVDVELHVMAIPAPKLFISLLDIIAKLLLEIDKLERLESIKLKVIVEQRFTLDQLYASKAEPPPPMEYEQS